MGRIRASAAYQIAVSYAAVFALAILVLGGATFFAVDAELSRHKDHEIRAELDRLSRIDKRAQMIAELNRPERDAPRAAFAYALFDRSGTRIAGSLDMPLPPSGITDASVPHGASTLALFRVGAVTLSDGERLVVAVDAAEAHQLSMIILKYFLILFASVLAISLVGGFVINRHLRKRLQPISATANAIVGGNLNLRVPVGAHGDEFDRAGQAFNLMLDRVDGLMQNLQQVSSDIAHDLRKPLIRLLCQTDRLGQVAGAEERVMETGDEMLALFSAILRTAEIESGSLERSFEPIDLSALTSEVAESFAPALVDAGDTIDWTIEPDLTVLGNRELLGQLAANLLDNARIHTPAGTAIRLDLAASGTDVKLCVEDNGPGVSDDDRDKLLQRFFRTDASRSTAGNGLGLSLVAATAVAHGGTVEVENIYPGLRIVVALPRLREETETQTTSPSRKGSSFTAIRDWVSARRGSSPSRDPLPQHGR